MPGSLSQIGTKPTARTDVRGYWKWIAQLIDLYDALCNFQVVTTSGKNALTITAGNAVLELNIAATAVAAAAPTPWQPSLSPWTGIGVDPYASTRALRFLIGDGTVNNSTPTNMTAEFVAYGAATDTELTQAEAVVTFVYWQANVSESQLGLGDVSVERPTINIIQGTPTDTLVGSDPSGLLAVIGFNEDGSLPAYIVGQICKVSWWGGSLHFAPGLRSYQSVALCVSGALGGVVQRSFFYSSTDGS